MSTNYEKGQRVKYRLVEAKRTEFGHVVKEDSEHVFIRQENGWIVRRLEHKDVRAAKDGEI